MLRRECRHPDIVQTADGTLVVVYAAMENPSPGKDVLMCTRSTDLGLSWSNPKPILCSRFTERPKDHVRAPGHLLVQLSPAQALQ